MGGLRKGIKGLDGPVMLLVLDGWGYSEETEHNAIAQADTPNFDRLWEEFPHTLLDASGHAVGLPAGQMGNSEVGHHTLGTGRITDQPLLAIDKALASGEFKRNRVILDAFAYVRKKDTELHLIGLVSDGGVHSHIDHLLAILDIAKEQGLNKVFVHAFLDGRDTPPKSAGKYLKQLEDHMAAIGLGKIAMIAGRYYAMDRDQRWARTKSAYDAFVKGDATRYARSAQEALEKAYKKGETDEFVKPTIIVGSDKVPVATIDTDEMVFFFNFRPDRARQLSQALAKKVYIDSFDTTGRPYKQYEKLHDYLPIERETYPHLITMREYQKELNVPVVFPEDCCENNLGQVLSERGYSQMRVAETEKYAHVTFFFDGGTDVTYDREEKVLVQSPPVATYDLKPEMSAYEVAKAALWALDRGETDVYVLNFANADMVGHTGVMDAAVKAVETVDQCLGKVTDRVLELGGVFLMTADHGNAERMYDPVAKAPLTSHTTSPVPCILSLKDVKWKPGLGLSCAAPTLLRIMGEKPPGDMTGTPLITTKGF